MAVELVGRRIRNIEVRELIGKGGMGWVYLGFDHALHRQVALKVIRPAAGLSEENKARFVREARVLSQLEHVNICRIYDFLDYNGSEILVLEYVEGKSLSEALKEGLSYRQRLSIARQLTEALIAAHGAGIVHRDLKPENVMWVGGGRGADGLVKILDFGLARSLQAGWPVEAQVAPFEDVPTDVAGRPEPQDEAEEGRDRPKDPEPRMPARASAPYGSHSEVDKSSQVTRFGRVMGTISYMSPEQARGELITTASDMFTLGLLFHEIFVGRPAYDPDLPTMEKLELASLAKIRPIDGVDPALANLIRRLESPLPDDRPRAVDVLSSLNRIARRPKRRLQIAAAASAAAILMALAFKYTLDLKHGQDLAENALRQARAAQASERQVTDFLVGVFKLVDPHQSQGTEVTVEQILRRGAEKVETDLKDQPATQARLLQTLGTVYCNLGEHEEAQDHFRRSVEVLRAVEDRPLWLAAALDLRAAEHQHLGFQQEAAGELAESLTIRRRILPPNHPDLALSLALFGRMRYQEGKLEEAKTLFEEALSILALPEPRLTTDGRHQWARCAVDLAKVWQDSGDPVRAETLMRQALGELKDLLGEDAAEVGEVLEALGRFLVAQERQREAAPLLQRSLEVRRKALPPSHPDIEQLALFIRQLDS